MSIEEEIRAFQIEVLKHMRFDLRVAVESTDENVVLEMSGTDRDEVLQDKAELLETFQYLLNRIFGSRLENRRIVADCDGFRRRKEEELRQIAQKASQRVKLTGDKEVLGLMNPHERRIVHLAVAEEGGVTTVSDGEGFMKRITILPQER
jgi:spoIIIJ-associated protein